MPVVPPFVENNPTPGVENSPVVSVITANINPTDTAAEFNNPNSPTDLAVWNDYKVLNRYEKDRHVYMMGITSPTPFQGRSVAFAKLAADTLLWISDWTASRLAIPPEIPKSTPPAGWILIDEHMETHDTILMGDADTPIYRISGTYVYGCLNPSEEMVNNVKFGLAPYYQPGQIGRAISPSLLKPNILAPQ